VCLCLVLVCLGEFDLAWISGTTPVWRKTPWAASSKLFRGIVILLLSKPIRSNCIIYTNTSHKIIPQSTVRYQLFRKVFRPLKYLSPETVPLKNLSKSKIGTYFSCLPSIKSLFWSMYYIAKSYFSNVEILQLLGAILMYVRYKLVFKLTYTYLQEAYWSAR
jgi:hypothetical protein